MLLKSFLTSNSKYWIYIKNLYLKYIFIKNLYILKNFQSVAKKYFVPQHVAKA